MIDKLLERVGGELFTLTHNPVKFDGRCRRETGDAPFWEYNLMT